MEPNDRPAIRLPRPIDDYVRQENLGEADLAECFAEDAVVHDEGKTHVGRAAIARWRASTKRKYKHSLAPLELAQAGNKTVLKAMVFGKFPGSPVVLDFAFILENEKITSLEIK
jgi:hypothetical protein